MPAEELAQGLVVSFSSVMSHRAAIFHGFVYAFISVGCYGSSSTRARAATIVLAAAGAYSRGRVTSAVGTGHTRSLAPT